MELDIVCLAAYGGAPSCEQPTVRLIDHLTDRPTDRGTDEGGLTNPIYQLSGFIHICILYIHVYIYIYVYLSLQVCLFAKREIGFGCGAVRLRCVAIRCHATLSHVPRESPKVHEAIQKSRKSPSKCIEEAPIERCRAST